MSKDKKLSEANPKFAFGFAVLVNDKGDVFIERNQKVFVVETEREATLLEVRRYVSEILMDLQAQSAAEYVSLRMGLLKPDGLKEESNEETPAE